MLHLSVIRVVRSRPLFVHAVFAASLSLSLSLSTLSASLSPSLLASSSLEPDDPRVREPLRSIVFNPTAQPLDQVGVAFLSSTRRGRDKFLFFAAIVQNDCIR